MGWQAFSVDAPELAETGRALLEQFGPGLAFLATVRADGAPRLHPVCPVLSAERLFVLITAASPKRRDLERDGRYALQTFPQPKPGSDEFYIAGTATLVEDAGTRARSLPTRNTGRSRRRSPSSSRSNGSCTRAGSIRSRRRCAPCIGRGTLPIQADALAIGVTAHTCPRARLGVRGSASWTRIDPSGSMSSMERHAFRSHSTNAPAREMGGRWEPGAPDESAPRPVGRSVVDRSGSLDFRRRAKIHTSDT